MAKYAFKDFDVEFNDDQAAKDQVFDRLLKFFVEHESFSGESIMQSDNPQIDAPALLSELADEVFCFKVDWKVDWKDYWKD